MKRYILLFVLACMIPACHTINQKLGLEDDNILEESGEALLKYETGVDMDFTPDTPEK